MSAPDHLTFGSAVPLDLLALAPHPDDAEIGCGATIARATAEGRPVGILDLTRGELGTLGTPETRDVEALEAARALGLAYRGNLRWPDGAVDDAPDLRRRLAGALRDLRPTVLLVPHEPDRHPDHVGAWRVARGALYLAALRRAPVPGEPHRVARVLAYQGNADLSPSLLVDVGVHLDAWARAVSAYRSQFAGEAVSETVTPEILERRRARMRYWGTLAGVEFAEAFWSERPLLGTPW